LSRIAPGEPLLRSTRRRKALEERLTLETSVPTSPEPEATLVHEALRRLEPGDREILLLAEWEGLSPAEIASVVGCLPVTARGRLHRARRRFRTVFEELSEATNELPVRRPRAAVEGGS
jgi:DNA-directed RNA polymerase specialized sigma24 family protein